MSISCNLFHYSRNNTSALKQAEFRGCVIQIYEERQELLHFWEQQSTFIMQPERERERDRLSINVTASFKHYAIQYFAMEWKKERKERYHICLQLCPSLPSLCVFVRYFVSEKRDREKDLQIKRDNSQITDREKDFILVLNFSRARIHQLINSKLSNFQIRERGAKRI